MMQYLGLIELVNDRRHKWRGIITLDVQNEFYIRKYVNRMIQGYYERVWF